MKKIIAGICAALLLGSAFVYAHSGRTNSEGCHNDRKAGTYHCH